MYDKSEQVLILVNDYDIQGVYSDILQTAILEKICKRLSATIDKVQDLRWFKRKLIITGKKYTDGQHWKTIYIG